MGSKNTFVSIKVTTGSEQKIILEWMKYDE